MHISNHIHYFLGVLKHTCPPQIYANYLLTLSWIEGNWTNKDQRTMLQIFAFAFAHSDRWHICPVNRVPIVSRYDFSPIWRQGIIWANAVLSSAPKEICFVEIWIWITVQQITLRNMHSKIGLQSVGRFVPALMCQICPCPYKHHSINWLHHQRRQIWSSLMYKSAWTYIKTYWKLNCNLSSETYSNDLISLRCTK